MLPAVSSPEPPATDAGHLSLTVFFDDPHVAAAMAVELFMEHDDSPLAFIGALQDLGSLAAPTDLLRLHLDGLVAA